MAHSRLSTILLLASLAVPACTGGPVGLDTNSPASMSAAPQSVTVEEGKSQLVDIQFKNVNNQALSTSTWLPLCSISNSNQSVADVTIENGKLKIIGLNAGTTTVTVSSSSSVKTTVTVTVTAPVPVITNVIGTITKGEPGTFFLTATGLTNPTVTVNGQVRPAVLEDPTHLKVTFTKEETYDLTAGTLQVRVFNAPNGALSDPVSVPVLYPFADIITMFPVSVVQGYPEDVEIELTVRDKTSLDGYHAFPTSRVRWESVELPTTWIDRNHLRARIPKAFFATAGTFNITVVNPAPGGGVGDPEPFTVLPANAGTATFDFSNYELPVLWAAQAQGNGAFAAVAIANGLAQFPVSAANATFAFVSSVGSNLGSLRTGFEPASAVTYLVTIISMTQAEMTGQVHQMAFPRGSTALSGTVTGVGAGELAFLLWGNGNAVTSSAQPTFSMANATPGPHRLVGYRKPVLGPPSASDRVFVRAGQAAGSGVGVDFTGAESAAAATATASLTGLIAGDAASASVGYITEPTCEGTLWYNTTASASFLIGGIPGAMQGPNDVHLFRTLITNGNHTLQQTFYSKPLIGFAATRPAPAAVPVVSTITTSPYLRRQAQVNLGSYEAGVFFYSTASITVTKGYLGGATGTIQMPDLSGVSGWNPAWAPPASPAWTFGANSYTSVLQGCASGTSATTVSVSGSTP